MDANQWGIRVFGDQLASYFYSFIPFFSFQSESKFYFLSFYFIWIYFTRFLYIFYFNFIYNRCQLNVGADSLKELRRPDNEVNTRQFECDRLRFTFIRIWNDLPQSTAIQQSFSHFQFHIQIIQFRLADAIRVGLIRNDSYVIWICRWAIEKKSKRPKISQSETISTLFSFIIFLFQRFRWSSFTSPKYDRWGTVDRLATWSVFFVFICKDSAESLTSSTKSVGFEVNHLYKIKFALRNSCLFSNESIIRLTKHDKFSNDIF